MTEPDFAEITYEVADHVATIMLSRVDKLNAFTTTMGRELIAAFDHSDADDDVRAVIVTGEGRAFCAGADLSSGGDTFAARSTADGDDDDLETHRDLGGQVSLRIFRSLKPVIAAVNGPAVGVGVTMTLPMDIRLASTNAKFGFVFNRRGIVPEAASSWFLPRVVGISQALEWTFSGRVFDADEALAGRLVRTVHEPDALLPAARRLAAEIADNAAPVSVALTRQMMWRLLGAEHPYQAHRVDSRAILERGRMGDVQEGIASFFEKRPPVFTDSVSRQLPDPFRGWNDPVID